MRRLLLAALSWLACCQPAAAPHQNTPADTRAPVSHSDCRDDIPDCVTVCALRETGRLTYVDFYERRCAAVILGRNPDRVTPVDLQPTPYDGGVPEPDVTAGSLSGSGLPTSIPTGTSNFDPTSVGRTSTVEPPECKAARLLRAQRRDREADVLAALCAAKGGDAGF